MFQQGNVQEKTKAN